MQVQGLPASDKNYIQISVADSGIGLKKEDLERIFKPFEQVDNSASRLFQGTGLGLSLTKSLVELHGGNIGVTSEGEGKGTTFSFWYSYLSFHPQMVFLPRSQKSRLRRLLVRRSKLFRLPHSSASTMRLDLGSKILNV